ncbi:MAG: hypothetical protein WB791_08925 [Waddliaceae bacterium]
MKIYFLLSTLVLFLVMSQGYSQWEPPPPEPDQIDQMEKERREIYGDPEEERAQYYRDIQMPDINKGSDYLLKDHPLEEAPQEENPIPDNPLQEDPIPARPLQEEPIR